MKLLLEPTQVEGGGGAAVAEPPAQTQDTGGDPFAGLDKRASTKPAKPAPETKKEDAPDPESNEFDQLADDKGGKKPDAKPADDKAKDDKAARSLFPKDGKITKEFREAHEKTVATNKELSEKIAAYEKKIAEFDSKGKDTTALTNRLAAIEKERDEARAELRAAKFEASSDFKKNYVKPFERQAEFARREIERLEVQIKDSEGNITGTRPAKWDDFTELYSLERPAAAAEAKFGPVQGGIVLNHLAEVRRLQYLKDEALAEEKAAFKQREEEDKANAELKKKEANEQKEAIEKEWTQTKQNLLDSHPEWQANPKDPIEKELLTEGYRIVETAMDKNAQMTVKQKIAHDASIYHRSAVQPLYEYRLDRANERIAELEAKLKGKKNGAPGETEHTETESPTAEIPMDEDLRRTLNS